MLSVEPNEDHGTTVNVKLFYVHLSQGIEEDDIGGWAIINEYPFDSTVGYKQGDDECIMARVNEGRVLIVNKGGQ